MFGSIHAKTKLQRGFTLIEMSIVLVIIGLIIGGILKGQEIIESSRQKNIITQVDTMRAAVNTFADKYNGLPGDYNLALTRINSTAALIANGDGDGIVDPTGIATAANIAADTGVGNAEQYNFFNHLALAELISGTTPSTAAAPAGFGDGSALPAIAVPGGGMTVVYGLYNLGNNPRQSHWLRLHKTVAGAADGAATGVLSGKRAFEMDLKIDDALPYEGTMRITGAGGTAPNCNNGAAYNSLDNSQLCAPIVELIQ